VSSSGPRSNPSHKRSVPTLTEILHVERDKPAALASPLSAPSPVPAEGIVSDSFAPAPTAKTEKGGPIAAVGVVAANVAAPVVLMPDGSLEAKSADQERGAQVTEKVLVELQRHIDLMLEYRLREALTPALARMTDAFIRDTRNELAATLREIVSRAVEVELTKLRRE
jgi:hypothetical protein